METDKCFFPSFYINKYICKQWIFKSLCELQVFPKKSCLYPLAISKQQTISMHTFAMSAIFNLLCLWHLLFAERWDVEMFPFSHGTLDIVKSRGSIRLGKIYAIHTHLEGNDRVLCVYLSLADIHS